MSGNPPISACAPAARHRGPSERNSWASWERKAALEAYTKAINNGAEPEAIEKGIKRYLKHIQKTNKEPRYIKLLATYFEGEHWNDVYNDTGTEPGEKAPPAGKDPNRGYYNKKGEWVTTSYDLAAFEKYAIPFR